MGDTATPEQMPAGSTELVATEHEKQPMAAGASKTALRRSPRFSVKRRDGGAVVLKAEGPTATEPGTKRYGTSEPAFAQWLRATLLIAGCTFRDGVPSEDDINGLLAAFCGGKPRDEIEAMLIAQMVATHAAAMDALAQLRAASAKQADSLSNLATRMLRTYAAQVEALQRYRGKGKQSMVIKHVHIHDGGQAVIGNISAGGVRGRRGKTIGQPLATESLARGETQSSAAMQGDIEAIGEDVSRAGG